MPAAEHKSAPAKAPKRPRASATSPSSTPHQLSNEFIVDSDDEADTAAIEQRPKKSAAAKPSQPTGATESEAESESQRSESEGSDDDNSSEEEAASTSAKARTNRSRHATVPGNARKGTSEGNSDAGR